MAGTTQIEYGQAAVAQRDEAIVLDPLVVRSAALELLDHGLNDRPIIVAEFLTKYTCDSAHDILPSEMLP
jgi:hypothetical protein